MVHKLILLRHGESEWNKIDRFCGWVDVKLTERGKQEAVRAGELLEKAGLKADIVYTSMLTRTIQTANITLERLDRLWLPVKRSWRLNERHYGALQGKYKSAILAKYGKEQFMTWRRSYDVPPPEIEEDSQFSQFNDERYADISEDEFPRAESLKLVLERLIPYWDSEVSKDIKAGKTVLIIAHGNSLRALIKHLDNVSDQDIAQLNVPTGVPFVYELDDLLKPIKESYYLDPEAAAAGAAVVAAQGTK